MAKKSKKNLKIAAKKAAASGNLTNRQVNQLQKAGVKNKVVNKIKTANSQGYAANRAQTVQNNQQQNSQQTAQQQSPAQQKPLTGNAVKDGRYGLGAQKEARNNYQMLIEAGVTDAFNPGRPGSRANITADGFVGKKELSKFANRKKIDESQARRRLSKKGASFTGGANKLADSVFSKNNPLLAMMIGNENGSNYYGEMGKNKARQLQIFKDSSAFDYSNKLPSGEVFEFRKKYGMVGDKPNPNIDRLTKIFGNPDATTLPNPDDTTNTETTNTGTTNTGTTNTGTTTEVPQDPEVASADPGVGQMSGGGMGAMGATKLGRARSRLQRLGILGRGTSLLGRGLQYGNTLNA